MQDLLEFDYKPKTKVTNIVATAEIGADIPLELLAVELGMDSVEYEPEQFPAIIYRGDNAVILVFASGKIVCTGLTDLEDTATAIEDMKQRAQTVI